MATAMAPDDASQEDAEKAKQQPETDNSPSDEEGASEPPSTGPPSSAAETEKEPATPFWVWFRAATELFHPKPDVGTDPPAWIDSSRLLRKLHFLSFLQFLYTFVFLPIRICFSVQDPLPWLVFDVVADLVHFGEMWAKLRTAHEEKGFFITEKKRIRQKYLTNTGLGGFAYDLFACLPLDYIFYAVWGYDCRYRANRLLAALYFGFYFKLFEDYNPRFSSNIIRLVKSALSMIATAHLLGCGYFLVLRCEGPDTNGDNPVNHASGGRSLNWMGYYGLFEMSVPRQYVRTLYWAFISMTGYGNTIPVRRAEVLYTTFVTLIGLSVYVNVIGRVGSLVSSLEATKQAHRTRMDTYNDWMRYRRFPQATVAKIKAYLTYMWVTRKGVDESQLLRDLPTYLRLEVAEFVNEDIIQKVPLFKDVSKAFLNAVILHLQPRVVLANAYICKTGDVGAEMFFISSGIVNVVIEEDEMPNKVVATLTDGSFFGEVALIYQTKRTATVVAHTVAERFGAHDLVSPYLREVSSFVKQDIIQKVPLFKDVSKAFLNAVILHLQPRVVLANAYICKTGDVGAEMFFISSGIVNVVIEEDEMPNKVVATLTDGSFFGEVALIYQTKRTATVVAHTVCEMYILKKVHFEEVLNEFSEYAVVILEKAAERFGAQADKAKRRQ
ncbi:Cyclic nucleotide-gated cation channel subunit A [Diplonema papillatum]|nr:Cyclic nucleotide-gated cation channel subunit A [Diplonema papillatum]